MKSVRYEKLEFKYFCPIILDRTVHTKLKVRCEKLLGRFARTSDFGNVPWSTNETVKSHTALVAHPMDFVFMKIMRRQNRKKRRKGEKDENTPWI